MNEDESRLLVDVDVRRRGPVTDDEAEQARVKVARLAHLAHGSVIAARVELLHERNEALARPAVAKAQLDVNGHVVRGHVAAAQMPEAIDLLEARLRAGLHALAERQRFQIRSSGPAADGSWRHQDRATSRPAVHPRPADERTVSRRKQYAPLPMMPEDAAAEMEARDYDFFLFENALTGSASLVVRREDGSLAVAHAGTPDAAASAPFATEPTPPRVLQEDEAIAMLDLRDLPYVFYQDAESGHGAVLYRRYDGHYGALEAIPPAPAEAGSRS